MDTRERTNQDTDGMPVGDETTPSVARTEADATRVRGQTILAASREAINKKVSQNSKLFVKSSQQDGGE